MSYLHLYGDRLPKMWPKSERRTILSVPPLSSMFTPPQPDVKAVVLRPKSFLR